MDGGGPWRRALVRSLLLFACVAGAAAGAWALWTHLATDPLIDVHAYYEAAGRLNAGLPLYAAAGDVNSPHFYFYPPLLAIIFRPLAVLPFEVAAGIWELVVLASIILTVLRIGLNRRTAMALALLGLPIAWAASIGQAQVVVTWLLAIGSPWSVALAANLKILPALVALYWLGRRDWRKLGWFVASCIGLLVVQFALAPEATTAFLTFPSLAQVGDVNNLSPYAISPILWGVLVVGGAAVVLRLAPGRWGWVAAIVYSVLATPRLLSYMLTSLLAARATPREGEASVPPAPSQVALDRQ